MNLHKTVPGLLAALACLAVTAAWADNTAPSITIVNPTSNQVVQEGIKISAQITDDTGVKAHPTYAVDGMRPYPISRCYFLPDEYCNYYNTMWVKNGSHTLTVSALDAAGNSATQSVVFISSNVPDTRPPQVGAITINPSSGSYVNGSVEVFVSASDNVGIQHLRFFVDGQLRHDSPTVGFPTASGGFAWRSWDTTQAGNGSHTLTVEVHDPWDNIGISSRTVIVNNPITGVAFGEVFVYPNPVRGGQATFSITVTPVSRLTLVVHDGRGREVLNTVLSHFSSGNDGMRVYTHAWNVEGKGRHYRYTVEAVGFDGTVERVHGQFKALKK